MKHQRNRLTIIVMLAAPVLLLFLSGCGSGGALGQLVTAAFSPQAAVSDLQIKGAAIGGFSIADILAKSPILARFVQPADAQEEAPTDAATDGFPESVQEDSAPVLSPETVTIPPEWAAILASAFEEKYILEVGLLGQKKTVRLVCSGTEEIDKCRKIPPNAPVRASVVPIEGNLFDLRRIVED